jgi:WYL_2, Sm-like SH3 beta-barrel fold
MTSTKYSLVETLKNGVVTVVFEKVNGDERTMRATLDPSLMPQVITEEGSESQVKRVQNENVINAWDVDANGWRSFRIDSIKSIQVL